MNSNKTNFIPEISIIIPALNEEGAISQLIRRLADTNLAYEVILVDGGSKDRTVEIAKSLNAIVIEMDEACRASQMNRGASIAKAPILYFVHADSLPPKYYAEKLKKVIEEGTSMGCFRFRFQSQKFSLRINSYFTRFPLMIFRGGDQSLFIKKELFNQLDGFDEEMRVMEDYDIIRRGKKLSKFLIIPDDIEVSARKYEENSYARVNLSNFLIFTLYYLGVPTKKLKNLYSRLINHPKEKATN